MSPTTPIPTPDLTDPVMADLVGAPQVAERLGVDPETVYQWRTRGWMPEALSIGSTYAWHWGTILKWAGDLGKLEDGGELAATYAEAFGRDPIPFRERGRLPAEARRRMVDEWGIDRG